MTTTEKINRDSILETKRDFESIERSARKTSLISNYKGRDREKSIAGPGANIMSSAKGIIGTAISAGSIMLPVQNAMKFESTMANITKVVDFSGGKEEIKSFGNEILKLSHVIPLTVTELGEISANGGQLGITKDKILGFTSMVAKMSTAFDMSAFDASENMAKLMNVYGGGIKGATNLGDAINHLSNNSSAKARAIVTTIGNIAGTAKTLKLTAVQASNLAGAFIALGKAPDTAGTAINSMLSKFGNIEGQSKKFKTALEMMGYSGTEFQKSIKEKPQKTIETFLTTLNKMGDKKIKISYDMFGNEFGDDILLLSGGVRHYQQNIKLTSDTKNFKDSMEEEFKIRSATTENSLILLKSKINTLGITFGTTLLPVINKGAEVIGGFALKVDSLAQRFPTLATGISTVGTAFVVGGIALTALAFTISLAGSGFAKMGSGIGSAINKIKQYTLATTTATVAQKGYNATLSAQNSNSFSSGKRSLGNMLGQRTIAPISSGKNIGLLTKLKNGAFGAVKALKLIPLVLVGNPLGLAITGMVTGATLVYQNWERVKSFFNGFANGFSSSFSITPSSGNLNTFFSSTLESIKNFKNNLVTTFGGISTFFKPITNAIKTMFKGVGNATMVGQTIGSAIGGSFQSTLSFLKDFKNGFMEAIAPISNGISKSFNEVLVNAKGLKNSLMPIFNGIGTLFKPIFSFATHSILGLFNLSKRVGGSMIGLFQPLISFGKNTVTWLGKITGATKFVNKDLNNVSSVGEKVGLVIGRVFSVLLSGIKNSLGLLNSAIQKTTLITKKIVGAFSGTKNFVVNKYKNIKSVFGMVQEKEKTIAKPINNIGYKNNISSVMQLPETKNVFESSPLQEPKYHKIQSFNQTTNDITNQQHLAQQQQNKNSVVNVGGITVNVSAADGKIDADDFEDQVRKVLSNKEWEDEQLSHRDAV